MIDLWIDGSRQLLCKELFFIWYYESHKISENISRLEIVCKSEIWNFFSSPQLGFVTIKFQPKFPFMKLNFYFIMSSFNCSMFDLSIKMKTILLIRQTTWEKRDVWEIIRNFHFWCLIQKLKELFSTIQRCRETKLTWTWASLQLNFVNCHQFSLLVWTIPKQFQEHENYFISFYFL